MMCNSGPKSPYTNIINDVPRAAHLRKVSWATYNVKCMHTYHLIPLIMSRPRSKTIDLNATTHKVLIPLITLRPRLKTIDPNATTHKILIPLIMSRPRSKINDPNATTHRILIPLIMSKPKSTKKHSNGIKINDVLHTLNPRKVQRATSKFKCTYGMMFQELQAIESWHGPCTNSSACIHRPLMMS
jgi:hypothetical protein